MEGKRQQKDVDLTQKLLIGKKVVNTTAQCILYEGHKSLYLLHFTFNHLLVKTC